jgi:hypothetical protein
VYPPEKRSKERAQRLRWRSLFHPLAQRELIESAKFYDERAAGLGADFMRQVERTLG